MALVLNNVSRRALLDEIYGELCDFDYNSARSVDNGWYNHLTFAMHTSNEPWSYSSWMNKDIPNGWTMYGLGLGGVGNNNRDYTYYGNIHDSHGSADYANPNTYHVWSRHTLYTGEYSFKRGTPVMWCASAGGEARVSGICTKDTTNIAVKVDLGRLNHGNPLTQDYDGMTYRWFSLTWHAIKDPNARQNYGFSVQTHTPCGQSSTYYSSYARRYYDNVQSDGSTRGDIYYGYRYFNYASWTNIDNHRVRMGVIGTITRQGSGGDLLMVGTTSDTSQPMKIKDNIRLTMPIRI